MRREIAETAITLPASRVPMSDDEDAELAAIRAKIQRDMLAARETAAAAPGIDAASPAGDVPSAKPVDLGEAEIEAFVRGNENVVVDCWAPWCGPCRIVGPIVDELARENAGRVKFAKLNVDLAPTLSRALQIQSIPTILFFRQGRLVERVVGAYPKPQLAALIERHYGRRASGRAGPRRM